MSSPLGDALEDIPIDDFKGATLQIDPASGQPSRTVSPSANISLENENSISNRSSQLKEAGSDRDDYLAGIASPPSPELVSSFYSGQGLSRSFYKQPPIGKKRSNSWHADSTDAPREVAEFFSVRVGALDQALEECTYLLDPELDGDIIGAWLLTEINHWDIEKERVVLLCDLSLLVIKYDFIALRHVHCNRIPLQTLVKLETGELTYPSSSLVPRINGIAGGVVTVLRGVLWNKIPTTLSRMNPWRPAINESETANKQLQDPNFSMTTVSFEPRSRNLQGVRVSWHQCREMSFSQKWNPFCKDVPFTTFTAHPLYWYTGCENKAYDVMSFSRKLDETLQKLGTLPHKDSCDVSKNSIVIENYVGIASLLHNVSELGFFKLRGKVSF